MSPTKSGPDKKHVDLFVTDWSNATQERVIRLDLTATGIVRAKVYAEQHEHWLDEEPRLLDGTLIGWEGLDRLWECFRGSYSGASDAHTDDECLFGESNFIPFIPARLPEEAS